MKPFEPTPSRLERARREGDHPVSRDLIAVAAFCGSLLAVLATIPILQNALRESLRSRLGGEPSQTFVPALTLAVVAICGCGSGAAILATLAQTRGLALRPLAFHLAFGRIFGGDALAATARATLAAGCAGLAIAAVIRPNPQALVHVVAVVLAVGITHALADVFAARSAWRRRLRMTHDELRRDQREHDGDPQTRARRRRLHRTLLRSSLRQVRRASFVVVNPTHVAVALRYVPPETPVPTILVRAADERLAR